LQFLSTVLACNSIYQQNGIIFAVTQYFAELTALVPKHYLKTNSRSQFLQQQTAFMLVGHPFHDWRSCGVIQAIQTRSIWPLSRLGCDVRCLARAELFSHA
jgi:hypothetical protein